MINRYTLAAIAALVFAGCGGSQVAPTGGAMTASHAAHGKSWMLPEAKGENLLYVSAGYVYVYRYGGRNKLVGHLNVYGNPDTLCSDTKGNVWVPVFKGIAYTGEVLEYAHGKTRPIERLKNVGAYPYGCAVDPTTGDLAVTNVCANYIPSCDGPGNVLIYKNGRGNPISRKDNSLGYYYYCAYDDSGNLYVDGTGRKHPTFHLAELPKGQSKFNHIKLSVSPDNPGAIQWDGGDLAITDTKQIYEFSIEGERGEEVGVTPLVGSDYVSQFWIDGKNVSVADYKSESVGFYSYPAGGSPTKTFGTPYFPSGLAVSVTPR